MATAALMQDKNSPAGMATLMGGMVNQWNNPFVYLVWMMFAQRMWGNDGIGGNGNVELNARINELQSQMQDYHNRYCVICRRRDTHTVRLSVFFYLTQTLTKMLFKDLKQGCFAYLIHNEKYNLRVEQVKVVSVGVPYFDQQGVSPRCKVTNIL